MISNDKTLLCYFGRKMLIFYKSLFDSINSKAAMIVIDEELFKQKAIESIKFLKEKKEYQTDYDHFLTLFNEVGTDYELSKKNTNANKFVALAIAVFQVLLANKVMVSNQVNAHLENEACSGYYEQIKKNLPNYQGNPSVYFSKQDDLWNNVKILFNDIGLILSIPCKGSGAYRYVRYPYSQRIIEPSAFREYCNKIDNLNSRIDYDISSLGHELNVQEKNFDLISSYLYQVYLLKRSTSFVNEEEYENYGELIFDERTGKLFSVEFDYDILMSNTFSSRQIFFYKTEDDGFWSSRQRSDCDVGVLTKKIFRESFPPTNQSIQCSNSDYCFICYSSSILITNKDLRLLFYPQKRSGRNIPERINYKVLYGVKASGRNTYVKESAPAIHFLDIICDRCRILQNEKQLQVLKVSNNVLDLSKNMDNIDYGEVEIEPLTNNESNNNKRKIVIFFEKYNFRSTKAFAEGLSGIGWNIKSLQPDNCYYKNSYTLEGLMLKRNENQSNNKHVKYDTIEFPIVNCGLEYPPSPGTDNEIIKGHLKNILNVFCIGSNEITLEQVFIELIRRLNISIQTITLGYFLRCYRLLKRIVLEEYLEDEVLYIIFYSRILTPYIKRVEYVKGIYSDSDREKYFKGIKVYGKNENRRQRLFFTLKNFKEFLSETSRSISFSALLNREYCMGNFYGIDYVEYCEIFCRIDQLGYSFSFDNDNSITCEFDLSNVVASEVRMISEIDYSKFQNNNETCGGTFKVPQTNGKTY